MIYIVLYCCVSASPCHQDTTTAVLAHNVLSSWTVGTAVAAPQQEVFLSKRSIIPASPVPQSCLLASIRTDFLSIKQMCLLFQPDLPDPYFEGRSGSFLETVLGLKVQSKSAQSSWYFVCYCVSGLCTMFHVLHWQESCECERLCLCLTV